MDIRSATISAFSKGNATIRKIRKLEVSKRLEELDII